MPNSYVEITSNGSASQALAFSFPYLNQTDIGVTVDGVTQTLTTHWSFATTQSIVFVSHPANGAVIRISRTTPSATRVVDFQDGSVLSEADLDNSADQIFFIAQEAADTAAQSIILDTDGKWEAQSKPIKNVTNPTNAQDAVTKNYLENTWLSDSDKTQLNSLNTTNLNTVAGSVSNVNTVAGAITNVNTVAGKSTEIAALGTTDNVSNMDTLAASGVVGNIASVAGISSDVTTVAGKASLITSDFVSDLNTVAVTDVINDINTLATSDIVSDLNQLATSDFVSDLNQLATTTNVNNLSTVAGIAGNVTSVAGVASDVSTVAGISSAVSTVAADGTDIGTVAGISSAVSTVSSNNANVSTVAGAVSNIGTVAGAIGNVNSVGSSIGNVNTVAGISSAVSTVAADATDIGNVSGSIANVNTVASNISGVNNFAAQYRTGSSDPTSSLDEGDLFYNTTANQLKVYNGSAWENAAPAGSGFLATSGGTMTGNLSYGDNVKATFGAGDLEIFHDGFNSYIKDAGTGVLTIQSNQVRFRNSAGTEDVAFFNQDAAVKLYYDSAKMFETTASGIDVTGTVQADQFNNDEALPDIRPSLLLDFANSKTLDPRITFTRGSTATYYDGKTTAKAEENLLTYSQEFNNWSLSNGTVTADSTTAPDGTTTADTFTATGANAKISLTKTYGDGGDATFSVYIKRKTGSGNVEISHTIFGTATVVSVTSDWQRFEVTTALSSGSRSFGIELVTSGDEVYVWGAQLEQRSAATAYTPTTTSPIVKYQPVLQTAASGEARFDHDPVTGESKGLLIEEARTNILPYSADFTNSAWLLGDNTTREGYTIAPDGSHNAVVVSGDGGGSQLFIRHQVSLAANTTYTFSAFAKRTHGTASTSGQILNVQYSNGSGTNTRSLVAVTNLTSEWVRYSTTVTNVEAYTGTMYLAVDTNSDSENIAVWGAQIEAGSFATSYIPTSGSTATRAADAAAITGSNFTDWYSNANGLTILAQIGDKGAVDNGDGSFRRIYTIGDGTVDNYFTLHGQPTGGYWRYRMDSLAIDNAVNAASYSSVSMANNQKVAVAFDTNDFAISVAGLAPNAYQTDSSFPMPTLTKLFIGANEVGSASTNVLIGTIKKIAIYPKRLPNATLQAMTSE